MKVKYISIIAFTLLAGCSKLEQKLNDSFDQGPSAGSADVAALLTSAYNSMTGIVHGGDNGIFVLQEVTSDEALVPTRGGDWDDGGVFRVLHGHTWTPIHVQIKGTFNSLGGIQHAATTVLAFNPSAQQRAEALFLRSFAQFYTLDLYGQVPYRPYTEYNSIEAAPVMNAEQAVDTLVSTLTEIIPVLPEANSPHKASPDAAKFLLMKTLLNKGAFLNRASPVFDNADMQSVIQLGEEIINSGKYTLNPNYFDNFGPLNATTSTEAVFSWKNTGASQADGLNSGGINQRWMMTLHYNSWNEKKGSAGWNGFSTLSDFYSTFQAGDKRVGQEPYPGVTEVSGLEPGFLVGPQIDENGVPLLDRQGNALSFTPEVSLIETQKERIEVAGIRVIKYPPDYTAYDGGNQRNQLQIFRYGDVVLMVAEAYARMGDMGTAQTMINELRAVRGASPITSLSLVNTGDVNDPNTILAERGREMYWEGWRRQDLIRFGVFGAARDLKPADEDTRTLLFPIAPDELLANPNLTQNPGY